MIEVAEYTLLPSADYHIRRLYNITLGAIFGDNDRRVSSSRAYERLCEEGVIRWAKNDQLVSLEMCEKIHWHGLQAQREAFENES